MGSQRNVDMDASQDTIKVVEVEESATDATSDDSQAADQADKPASEQAAAPTRVKHGRSQKYTVIRSQLDKTRLYNPREAIELVKRLSYSNFTGTIVAHGVLRGSHKTELTFPHSTGKTIKVAIASDDVLKQIEDGNIDFDVLLSTPEYMSKLAKHAPILGPQGLMPNPKNGTLTENPEELKAELEAGKVLIETEKKQPLIHVTIGQTDMETDKLLENLQHLITTLKTKLVKLSLAATMSPGVRVDLSNLRSDEASA